MNCYKTFDKTIKINNLLIEKHRLVLPERKLVLECLSDVIVVIRPANTGRGINNGIEVKNILRGNEGIDNADCKIANDVAFNIVTVRLIGPNKELNPTKCKEEH